MPPGDRARRILWRCALASTLIAGAAAAAPAQDDVTAMAMSVAEDWLGPRRTLDAGAHSEPPLWQGRGAMIAEARSAERIVRSWWPSEIADTTARAIVDGFARYLQTHITERVYDRRHLRQAYRNESRRYFGGHIVWSFPPLRLSRNAAVNHDQYAAVFASLEKWIGLPALQAAMFEVARLPESRLTGAEMIKTLSDAAGQDLSWAFAAADSDVNYAVTNLSAAQADGCGTPCFDSAVTVTRSGNGTFTGRAGPPVGDFDSGDALEIKVMFAGGGSASAFWDGRDQSRTFHFRGPAPATAAYLDPRHAVTLDRNRLDNATVTPAPTNVPVHKWVARWMVWLQHTMLAYGFLG